MADSHSSRVPLSPAELVGGRIDENRLFEARFLFQKFSAEIDPAVGGKLRKQLENRIARAEKTFAQGELLERAGKLEQAGKVYADLAVMVIDYPALDEARQRVEIAIKLGPLESVEPSQPEVPGAEPSPSVISPVGSTDAPVAGPSFVQYRNLVLLLVFFLLAALGAVSFLIFSRPRSELPVAAGSVVQALPEALPLPEKPEPHSSVNPTQPEPATAGPDVVESDRNNSDEKPAAEADPVEQKAALSAVPVPLEKQTDAGGPPSAAQKEPDSRPVSDSKVSVAVVEPVGPKEEAGRAAVSSVQVTLPEAAPVSETDGRVATGGTVQEKRNSSSELHGVAEISETTDTSSGKETSGVPVDLKENPGVEDGVQEKGKPGPTVDPGETEASAPAASGDPRKIYTVQEGDTLETIAARVYGNRFKWSLLVAANQEKLGSPPYVLLVGMQLQVPPLESSTPGNGTALLNDDGTYTVQSGDSLGSIALKLYGASWKWDTLYQLNRDRLAGPTALRVGQRLLVDKKNIPDGGDKDPVGE